MLAQLATRKTIRGNVPRIPFEKLLRAVFPQGYELSLVICGDDLARSINKKYRKKTYAANVLSFPLSKTEGELFLNVRCSEREARSFGVSRESRLALLFVHGLFHLKGLHHGRTMEREERRVLRAYKLGD
ncbi:MAG TPA: rRNA maturation RNase YbeY [Candidatus Paceibacterota bacterium]|nr:rRNA maturation RNase YbeY [Candidatus Paceibacterota bacterium]